MVSVPTNKALYARVKAEAKRKFKVWPSAYGSGWLVKEYKRRGGKYRVTSKSRKKSSRKRRKSSRKRRKSSKYRKRSKSPKKSRGKSRKKSRRSNQTGLGRWFAEEWINVCKLPKIVPCGRSKAKWKNYPYCRPRRRINKGTPKTAGELSKAEIDRRCRRKRSSPKKRVTGKSKSRRRK